MQKLRTKTNEDSVKSTKGKRKKVVTGDTQARKVHIFNEQDEGEEEGQQKSYIP